VTTQQGFRFIDAGKVRRPPLVGVNFLHERRAGIAAIFALAGLMRFIVRQLATSGQDSPRCNIALRVFTPSGMQAVRVRYR
jgi:hypothetical protein